MADDFIQDEAALRALRGEANDGAVAKTIDRIDDICARFIAASPFVVVATQGADGLPDISPKGDPAGFVAVLDEKTLAVPDRPGNNRFDSFGNLFQNPGVALLFMIPGQSETLRVAGDGRLSKDPALLERLAVNGKPALAALVVDVREAFLHCSKCMIRSRLWKPEEWPDRSNVATMAEAMQVHAVPDVPVDVIDQVLKQSEKDHLY